MATQQEITDQLIDYIDKAILKNSVSNRQVAAVLAFLNEGLKNKNIDIEELKKFFLSNTNDDKAAGLITFLKGLISEGLIKAEAGLEVINGTTTDTLIASETVSGKSVIASEGVGGKTVTATDTVTGKNVVASEKVTTLNLLVQALADTYDLNVSHVATLFRTIVKDYISSEQFIPGFTGNGMKLYKALSGDWNLELDNLTVRKAMTVFELIISKIRAVNGGLVISPANGKVKSVLLTNGIYRLEIEDDMMFVADDLVRCQSFSVKSGVKYYWVRITSVSGSYIFINALEFTNSLPAIGDDLVQFGNKTNKLRQGLLYLTAAEDGKPRISVLDSVNSTDLTGKTKVILGCLDGITDIDFPADFQPSGYGLYSANAFLKGVFILRNGKTIEDELSDKITAVQTAFEIREGQISAKVTEVTTKATQAATSATNAKTSETNASGSATTAGQKATAAANSATAASGSATAAKKSADDAGTILEEVTVKESSITQTAGQISTKVTEVNTKVTEANTAATNAKKSETNASGSATTAGQKATAASGSAGAAATKAGEAATSATNAKASADSASSKLTTIIEKESSINQTAGSINLKVTEVTKKATEAATSATSAKTSETNAGSKATAAGSSATAAAGSAATSGAKAGEAATSATNAKKSADDAATKLVTITQKETSINQTANSINLKATEVTTKATEAATSANNAAGSASTANSKATAAGTSATNAASSASAASGSATTAGQKATAAANSASDAATKLATITTKETSINQTASQITIQASTVTTKTAEAVNAAELAAAMSKGRMLYRDPTFESGYNGTTQYLGNATRSIVAITGCPNRLAKGLKITATGWSSATDLRIAGFLFGNQSRANAVFVVRIVALIPVGRSINNYHNAYGTGGTTKWLTSIAGTGKWEEYACKVTCDASGTFSTVNHFALFGGAAPTATVPVTWYVAYATVFDTTDVDDVPTVDEIKAGLTVSAGKFSIFGKDISLAGAVTFSSLDSAAQGKITAAQSTANTAVTNAGNAQTKANEASSAAGTAQTTANNAQSSANTANSSLNTLKGSLKSLAYLDTVEVAKLGTTVIEGGYLKTTLIKANSIDATKINVTSIQAAVVTAAKIAALDITTNRLTVTSGAKIGGWSVEGNSLAIRSAASAKILVEPSGTRFLRINDSTDELMTIRADGVTGLRIYTQNTTGKCLALIAQAGGTAINSYGNHNFTARQGEKTIFEGYTNTGGLGVKVRNATSSVTLDHSDCWVSCNNTGTITVYLPSNPPVGKMIFIVRINGPVTVDGGIYKIRYGGTSVYRDPISNSVEVCFYLFDGSAWMSGWFNF